MSAMVNLLTNERRILREGIAKRDAAIERLKGALVAAGVRPHMVDAIANGGLPDIPTFSEPEGDDGGV